MSEAPERRLLENKEQTLGPTTTYIKTATFTPSRIAASNSIHSRTIQYLPTSLPKILLHHAYQLPSPLLLLPPPSFSTIRPDKGRNPLLFLRTSAYRFRNDALRCLGFVPSKFSGTGRL